MPTNWDEHYRDQDTPWDRGGPSPALLEFLEREAVTGQVLVPGCGYGHDVRALAEQRAAVTGLDISPLALKAAHAWPRAAEEGYILADLFALPEPMNGAFDWVVEHTCFCAIDLDRRPDYVAAVARALRPGGKLLAVFYLDPGHSSPTEGPPFGVSIPELDRLFIPRFSVVEEWQPRQAYAGREGREWMRVLKLRDSPDIG